MPNGNRVARVEVLLSDLGLSWEFVEDFNLASLIYEDGTQVRKTEHRAPKERVGEYAVQMKAGAEFPPIIVGDPNVLVDGNTRVAAAELIKKAKHSAYVVKFSTFTVAKLVAGTLNNQGGQRLDTNEAKKLAQELVNQGFRADDPLVVRATAVSKTTLQNWAAERSFQQRATKAGLGTEMEKIPTLHARKLLNDIKSDPVLVEAIKVSAEAQLPVAKLRELVKSVEGSSSEAEAFTKIADVRTDNKERIEQLRAGASPVPSPSGRAAAALGMLAKLASDFQPREFVPLDSEVMRRQHPKWRDAVAFCQAVLAEFDAKAQVAA